MLYSNFSNIIIVILVMSFYCHSHYIRQIITMPYFHTFYFPTSDTFCIFHMIFFSLIRSLYVRYICSFPIKTFQTYKPTCFLSVTIPIIPTQLYHFLSIFSITKAIGLFSDGFNSFPYSIYLLISSENPYRLN